MKKVYKRFTKKELWEIIQSQTLQIIELKHKVDMYETDELIREVDELLKVVQNGH
jgi:hypothetical protein